MSTEKRKDTFGVDVKGLEVDNSVKKIELVFRIIIRQTRKNKVGNAVQENGLV